MSIEFKPSKRSFSQLSNTEDYLSNSITGQSAADVNLSLLIQSPRKLGYTLNFTTLQDALKQKEAIIMALLKHGVIALRFEENIDTPSILETFLQSIGTPQQAKKNFLTIPVSQYVNAVANVDHNGNNKPNNYRHSGFWHSDGQFYNDADYVNKILCNVMCPIILNKCRTQFLDITLNSNSDITKYESLQNTTISLQRQMDNKIVAHAIKPVWRQHPITGKTYLLVPGTRYFEDENFKGIEPNCPWPSAKEVRAELANETGRRYDHQYVKNELVVWDNSQVLHRAEGNEKDITDPRYILRSHVVLSKNDAPKSIPATDYYETIIVGAGASGIVLASELINQGLKNFCLFESDDNIGGVYRNVYKGARLVSSNNITTFSTMTEDHQNSKFLTTDEYKAYLLKFSIKNKIFDKTFFNHKIISIKRSSTKNKGPGSEWQLKVKNTKTGLINTFFCRQVAVCTGVHANPVNAQYPILNDKEFTGQVINATEVSNPENFKGKTVVVVGGGEMASDLALYCAKSADKVYAAIRGMGRIVPRTLQGQPLDTSLSRGFHSINRNWDTAGPIQWRFKATRRNEKQAYSVHSLLTEWNKYHSGELTAFRRYATKTDALADAVLNYKAVINPSIIALEENDVIFADESRIQADVIINCIGFSANLSFLQEELQHIQIDNLYLRMFHPRLGTDLAFFGFIRPEAGGIPPMVELQARYYAALLHGNKALPSPTDMFQKIRVKRQQDLLQFPLDASRYPALTDFYFYLEELAELIGCRPKALSLIKHPKALFKLLWGPLSTVHYRLNGPGSSRQLAIKVLNEIAWSRLWPDIIFLTPLWCVSELHRLIWKRSRNTIEPSRGYTIETLSDFPNKIQSEINHFLKEEFWEHSPIVARLQSRKKYSSKDVSQTISEEIEDADITVLLRYNKSLVGTLFITPLTRDAKHNLSSFANDLTDALQLPNPPFNGNKIYTITRLCVHHKHAGRLRSLTLIKTALLELEAKCIEDDICIIAKTAAYASTSVLNRAGFKTYHERELDEYIPWGSNPEVKENYQKKNTIKPHYHTNSHTPEKMFEKLVGQYYIIHQHPG